MISITTVSPDTTMHEKQVKLLSQCRNLVNCLYCFNNGQSVQKKYIFCVIEQRMPVNLTDSSYLSTQQKSLRSKLPLNFVSISTWKNLANVITKKQFFSDSDGFWKDSGDDDNSSAGGKFLHILGLLHNSYSYFS